MVHNVPLYGFYSPLLCQTAKERGEGGRKLLRMLLCYHAPHYSCSRANLVRIDIRGKQYGRLIMILSCMLYSKLQAVYGNRSDPVRVVTTTRHSSC